MRGLAHVKAARHEHVQAHGSEPTSAELAEAAGMTESALASLLAIERAPRSLEEPVREEGSATLAELVADPEGETPFDQVLDALEIQGVRELAEGLDEREQIVLSCHYGLGRPAATLREIGVSLGLTAERVRQIEAGALEKLLSVAAGI